MTPISLQPENPHYFLFRGKPAVLITSAEHYGAVLNQDFQFAPYLDELQARLDGRKRELQLMRHITSATPVALGGALVIPEGLMRKLRGDAPEDPVAAAFAADAAARARIEQIAMKAVQLAEEASQSRSRLSHTVARLECKGLVSRDTCGADKRGVNARLTEDGYAFLEKAAVDHVTAVREFFVDVIDPEDLKAIGRAFSAIAERVAKAR